MTARTAMGADLQEACVACDTPFPKRIQTLAEKVELPAGATMTLLLTCRCGVTHPLTLRPLAHPLEGVAPGRTPRTP